MLRAAASRIFQVSLPLDIREAMRRRLDLDSFDQADCLLAKRYSTVQVLSFQRVDLRLTHQPIGFEAITEIGRVINRGAINAVS